MISFLLIIIIIAAPLSFLMWKKRYYEGIIIGQLIFLFVWSWYVVESRAGPIGWISQYYDGFLAARPDFVVRFALPTLVLWLSGLFAIDHPYMTWLLLSGGIWWLGLILFQQLLLRIGFNRPMSVVGALLPIAGFASVHNSTILNPDALNWLIVLGIMWAAFSWRHRKNPWWLLVIPPLLLLAASIEFPVVFEGGWALRITYYLELNCLEIVASAGPWLPFIIYTLRKQKDRIPAFSRMTLWFLPIYAIIFIIMVDWDRWWTMAAPIWVPLVLIALQSLLLGSSEKTEALPVDKS